MNPLVGLLIAVMSLNAADLTSREWYQAIRNNQLSELKSMASSPSAVNVHDPRGSTPLMYAAAIGSPEALKLLLEAGAEVNAKNGVDVTPLHFAGSEIGKVRLLIAAGANVNARSKAGRTPLIVASARPGSIETVRLLLSKGADPKAADRGNSTALIEAAHVNDVQTLRLLLSREHEINGADRGGVTPLMHATGHANLTAVKLLLEKGADVNAAIPTGNSVRAGKIAISEMTALMMAATSSPEVIDTLLEAEAKVNARDVRGMTPLMFAVATDVPNLKTIRMLMKAGADQEIKSTDNELARDWAAKYNHPGVASVIRAPAGLPKPTLAPGGEKKRYLRESIEKGLGLLQRSSTEYFQQTGCVGCHHQPMAGFAVERALRKGLVVDTAARAEQLRVVKTEFASTKENLFQGMFLSVDELTFTMLHLNEAEYPADDLTDALASAIASQQQPDGTWGRLPILRPPLQGSTWVRTALAARALARYTIPARKTEFEARIANVRRWLSGSRTNVPYESTFKLLGLVWTNAPAAEIKRAAAEVKSMQRTDGGWVQLNSLSTDAFATGVALYALAQSGMSPQDEIYRRGVDYLLATQKADGSWHVPSRAPKLQPYFQSGFPHNHDQWISSAATAFAAAALTEALQPTQKSARVQ